MRWSTYIPGIRQYNEDNLQSQTEKLQKQLLALDRREKELFKKEKALQKKAKQLKKRNNKNKDSVNADIKAATKLLLAKNKLKKRAKQKRKNAKQKDNWFKFRKQSKDKSKGGFIKSPGRYVVNLLTHPCNCNCNPRGRGNLGRRRGDPEPSCLRKIFGGPCSCPLNLRTQPPALQRMLGFQTCRCEYPKTRERPYYGASGDCYLMTLRKTPNLWIYHRWPHFYSYYLSARHQWKNLRYCLLICAAILFWMPCILCLQICKCFCCACCSD